MRGFLIAFAFFLAVPNGTAQRHRLSTINAETPEGALLQQIGQEEDTAKKLALLEKFAAEHPKHEAILWVYEQQYAAYAKANQFDKALESCDKLLTADPEDARSAHGCLKAAEAKKDPDAIRTWSERGSQVARKVAALPKPAGEEEAAEWTERVDFARQFDVYTEYSLYAAALATTDAKKKLELLETLERRNEKYEHLPVVRDHVFRSLLQAQDVPGAVALSERLAAKDQATEDMLLLVAHTALNAREFDKAIGTAGKLIGVMSARTKPDNMSDADWTARRNNLLGRAHYIAGVAYGIQSKHSQCDKTLREGLPFMEGNNQLLAGAYFYLGLANFRLGDLKTPVKERILDALKFNQLCAGIKSPFQAQAQSNIKAIRSQYHIK
mgnify:CR=1 FL=1